jgi:predicted transcriptional regulator
MSPRLKELIGRIDSWPQEAQEEAAEFLSAIEEEIAEPYELTDDDRAAIERGLDAVRRGDIATDEEVKAVLNKYRRS